MLQITPALSISENELEVHFLRASGPGGQNVNKVATVVQLRFDVKNSPSLTGDIKNRLALLAGSKMNREGILLIEAKRFRTQERNRADAESRLIALVRKAAVKPRPRHPTRPSPSSQVKRLETKKHRGSIKRIRKSPADFED
jgi:ribosome-associated protein